MRIRTCSEDDVHKKILDLARSRKIKFWDLLHNLARSSYYLKRRFAIWKGFVATLFASASTLLQTVFEITQHGVEPVIAAVVL